MTLPESNPTGIAFRQYNNPSLRIYRLIYRFVAPRQRNKPKNCVLSKMLILKLLAIINVPVMATRTKRIAAVR